MTDLVALQQACLEALEAPGLRLLTDRLAGQAIDAAAELTKGTAKRESSRHLAALAPATAVEAQTLGRWLLLRAALSALPGIPSWRVSEPVKRLWADDVLFYAKPAGDPSIFAVDNVRFQEMARIVTLRRWPAGQFHGEIAALPRSYALHTSVRLWPKLFATLAFELRGFGPLVETHLNVRRKNRLFMTESEGMRSYYRLARSIELRPEIKGLLAGSWLYCASTAEITPHLAWLRGFFLKNGAFAAAIGPAPTDSGFLIGGEKRRQAYEEGLYRPTLTYILWPRKKMLEWAEQFPEPDV